jgi:hypothetical protein
MFHKLSSSMVLLKQQCCHTGSCHSWCLQISMCMNILFCNRLHKCITLSQQPMPLILHTFENNFFMSINYGMLASSVALWVHFRVPWFKQWGVGLIPVTCNRSGQIGKVTKQLSTLKLKRAEQVACSKLQLAENILQN